MSCFREVATLSGVHIITFGILAGYRIVVKKHFLKLEKETREDKKEIKELKEKFCELEKKLAKQEKQKINFQTR